MRITEKEVSKMSNINNMIYSLYSITSMKELNEVYDLIQDEIENIMERKENEILENAQKNNIIRFPLEVINSDN